MWTFPYCTNYQHLSVILSTHLKILRSFLSSCSWISRSGQCMSKSGYSLTRFVRFWLVAAVVAVGTGRSGLQRQEAERVGDARLSLGRLRYVVGHHRCVQWLLRLSRWSLVRRSGDKRIFFFVWMFYFCDRKDILGKVFWYYLAVFIGARLVLEIKTAVKTRNWIYQS